MQVVFVPVLVPVPLHRRRLWREPPKPAPYPREASERRWPLTIPSPRPTIAPCGR